MNRRAVAPIGLLALVLAFVIPATMVAAGPFVYKELSDTCDPDTGQMEFGVRVKEKGLSGATSFKIRSKVQYTDKTAPTFEPKGRWKTLIDYGWDYSIFFPNNSTTYYHDLTRMFNIFDDTPGADIHMWHRIWMRVQVWGGNTKLDEKIMTGDYCTTAVF